MRTLFWRHRGWWTWTFELMEGDRRLAVLAPSGWTMRATLSIEGHESQIHARGLFRWRIALEDGGREWATMTMGFRGQGEPTLSDGRRFRWYPENFWGTRWVLEDPERGWRARVHMDKVLKMDARVDVEDGAPDEATLVRVLALAWYSAVISMQSATSAGTIAAVT